MNMTAAEFIKQRNDIDRSNSEPYPLRNIMRRVSISNLDSFKRDNTAKLKNKLAQKELSFQEVVLILMYRLSKYFGLTAYRLANKRGITNQPLCKDALNIFQNNMSMRLSVDELFTSYVNICNMLKSAKKMGIPCKSDDANFLSEASDFAKSGSEYHLNLPGNFLQYKVWLSKAKLASEKFIKLENIKRNAWFKLTCKMNKLSMNDAEVMGIYNDAIKNDNVTKASEFLGKAVERLSDAINDRDNAYRYAFYTLKLFDVNKKMVISNIPSGVGLDDEIMSEFTLPIDIKNILADESIDKDFYLSKSTRKTLDSKFAKLAESKRSGKPIGPAGDVVAEDAGEKTLTPRRRGLSLGSNTNKKPPTRTRSGSFGGSLFTRPKSSGFPSSGKAGKTSDVSSDVTGGIIEKLNKRMRTDRQLRAIVENYTGDIPFNLYEKKRDLLREDVVKEIEKIIGGQPFKSLSCIAWLHEEKTLTLVNDHGISYTIKFPSLYDDFKKELSKIRDDAAKLKEEIDVTGKIKRDDWLKEQCDLYYLDVNDARVKKIYTEAIADDPTITTSKRLAGVISGLDEAIKNFRLGYEQAFYTLKLFADDTIRQLDIPRGCGLGSGITSAFLMVPEFNAILEEGTLDREFYLNTKTRDAIEKKLKKLAPPSELPKEAFEAMGMKL